MKRYLLAWLLALCCLSLSARQQPLSADSLVSLGRRYYDAQRYIEALDAFGQAMDKADREGNDKPYLKSMLTIGNIYILFEDYEQALHFYSTCLERAKATGDRDCMAKLYNNMIICYVKLGNYKEAEACYKRTTALGLGNKKNDQFHNYVNQALLYTARKYYKGAVFFHTQALRYASSHNMDKVYVAAEMGQIGAAYEEAGDLKEAEKWFLDCYDYARKHNCMGVVTTSCDHLATLYRRMGRDDLYAKYNKLYARYTDSLFKQQDFYAKRSRVNDYEGQIKDRQMSALSRRNRTLTLVILTIGTLLALLALLLVYIYKVNRRLAATQRLLIKKNQEYSRQLQMQEELFSRIGHGTPSAGPQAAAAQAAGAPRADTEAAAGTAQRRIASADTPAGAAESTRGSSPAAGSDEADLLTKQQTDLLLMEIAHVMEDTDTVCNPDFSLTRLAQLVDSNTKYVSWAINKSYGKNFKTYLNEYRIRTASQLLASPEAIGSLTIAGIAERVGYKSPASFHQAFKKIYAMTPAAYVKLARQKEA